MRVNNEFTEIQWFKPNDKSAKQPVLGFIKISELVDVVDKLVQSKSSNQNKYYFSIISKSRTCELEALTNVY